MADDQDIRESEARILKLEAERKVLQDQLSGSYRTREWLKAGATAVGFLGLFITLLSALLQFNESRRVRSDERFEQAVKSLAGEKVAERLSGVSALNGFLAPEYSRESDALSALVNGLAIESDAVVRAAITDIFTHIGSRSIPVDALNSALSSLVNRNRTVGWMFLRSRKGDLRDFIMMVDPEEGKVAALGQAIVLLLRAGATNRDFSEIYCIACDFSGLQLKEADFSKARLPRSTFRKADLDGAIFVESDIQGADFTFANLRNARFSSRDYFQEGTYRYFGGTNFSCADLGGANFDGFNLLLLLEKSVGVAYPASLRFQNARLANARFSGSTFVVIMHDQSGEYAFPFPTAKDRPPGEVSAVDERGLYRGGPALMRASFASTGTDVIALNRFYNLRLKEMFANSDWKNAVLPESLRSLLEKEPPSQNLPASCEAQ